MSEPTLSYNLLASNALSLMDIKRRGGKITKAAAKPLVRAIGTFAMFLQEPLGMLIFIGVPVAAFILFMVISKRRAPDPKRAELEAELERLRAMAAGMSSDTSTEGGENTEDGEKQDAEGGESGSDKTDA